MAGFSPIAQRVAIGYLVAPLAIAALSAQPAGACPDLAGSYLCEDDGATYPLHLTQEVQSGQTVYTFGGAGDPPLSFVADGETHETDNIEHTRSSTLRGWCEGGDVKVERRGAFMDPDSGKEIGNIELTYAMHLDGDVLVYGQTGFVSVEGRQLSVDGTVRCQRKHD